MCCNKSKPGPCCHLSFPTNPGLSNIIGKLIFFVQFELLLPKYSEKRLFLNKSIGSNAHL